MKSVVTVSVDISAADLERIAREQLGLERPGPKTRVQTPAPALSGPIFDPRSSAVAAAISHVIRATDKFNQDQYSPGEASAATALFEAGKRLKKAVSEERHAKSKRGVFNV
jgi:hypothetical protein